MQLIFFYYKTIPKVQHTLIHIRHGRAAKQQHMRLDDLKRNYQTCVSIVGGQ